MKTSKPEFAIVLRDCPHPGSAPVIIRLRHFLKSALRQYGLRAIECRTITPKTSNPNQG